MKRQYARLTVVEYDRPVTAEDTDFLSCLKQGLIMCLREKEFLNEKQCTDALRYLQRQYGSERRYVNGFGWQLTAEYPRIRKIRPILLKLSSGISGNISKADRTGYFMRYMPMRVSQEPTGKKLGCSFSMTESIRSLRCQLHFQSDLCFGKQRYLYRECQCSDLYL